MHLLKITAKNKQEALVGKHLITLLVRNFLLLKLIIIQERERVLTLLKAANYFTELFSLPRNCIIMKATKLIRGQY